jgi:cobalamin 5''-phosphate synthase/cobalamin synthase
VIAPSFWLALQFLTRLPTPRGVPFSPAALGLSVVMYPVVGLVIGLILVAVASVVAHDGAALSAALVLAVWVMVTGGLHLDGLADCADAWMGGAGSRERSLEIMKDPHTGSSAIVAVALLLLLKYAALVELLQAQTYTPLLLAPMMGRAAIPALLLITPYVRTQGLGRPLAEHLPRRGAASAVAAVIAVTLVGLDLWVVSAVAGSTWVLRRFMLQRLGGCTGDTLGASVEITEAVVLTAAVLGRA